RPVGTCSCRSPLPGGHALGPLAEQRAAEADVQPSARYRGRGVEMRLSSNGDQVSVLVDSPPPSRRCPRLNPRGGQGPGPVGPCSSRSPPPGGHALGPLAEQRAAEADVQPSARYRGRGVEMRLSSNGDQVSVLVDSPPPSRQCRPLKPPGG